MKKLTVFLSLMVLLTACGTNWDTSVEGMPEDLKAFHEEQLAEYLEKLEEAPYERDYLFEVAYRYSKLGEGKKAAEYYLEVLKLDPQDRATLNNLAALYEEVGEDKLAAKYIVDLFNLDSGNTEYLRDTVRILLKAGFHNEAQLAIESYATLVGGTGDEATALFISDQYQKVVDYRTENNVQ